MRLRVSPHEGQENWSLYTWGQVPGTSVWPCIKARQSLQAKRNGDWCLDVWQVICERVKAKQISMRYWQLPLYLPSSPARSQVHQSTWDWSAWGAWPVQCQCKSFSHCCAWKDKCSLSTVVAEWDRVSLELPFRHFCWGHRKAHLQEERMRPTDWRKRWKMRNRERNH